MEPPVMFYYIIHLKEILQPLSNTRSQRVGLDFCLCIDLRPFTYSVTTPNRSALCESIENVIKYLLHPIIVLIVFQVELANGSQDVL